MHKIRWSQRQTELALVAAGLIGLATAGLAACGTDTTSTTTDDAGTTSTDGATASNDATTTGDGASVSGKCTLADTSENTKAVVAAANALSATLTAEQKTAIQYEKTLANAQQWSNFPTTFVKRNGVRLADMSVEARAAAVALAEAAAGAQGAKLLSELRAADQWLVTDGKASSADYGDGLYYFSFHGTPSASAPWMLQVAGHHLAYNFTYNGRCTGASPLFEGAEPMDWTDNGTARSPMASARGAMVALVGAVSAKSEAKLTGTFNDLVNGPAAARPGGGTTTGNGDTKYRASLTYPSGTTGRGVAVATLSAEQKALVKTAIEAWVKNVADPVSSAILAEYESDAALAETYVGYAGATDLTSQSSYVRIDGPRVWIEASVQGGIVYRNVVHWHTIWRDKISDYGADFVE
ncbi:MAG: DUF3500 domain-containing protein [Myxococcales bacterium]|nr:DUF3500 domain-containing protein [Myxococcales bacterium]